MTKLTKEQAIAKIAELEAKDALKAESSEKLREVMSKALGAPRYKKSSYSDEYTQSVYSWYEILIELGKLMSKRDYVEFGDELKNTTKEISRLHERIEMLENELRNHSHNSR